MQEILSAEIAQHIRMENPWWQEGTSSMIWHDGCYHGQIMLVLRASQSILAANQVR